MQEPGAPEIEVTPEMIEAGVEVLREMSVGDTDLDYRVEQIFLAMTFAAPPPLSREP